MSQLEIDTFSIVYKKKEDFCAIHKRNGLKWYEKNVKGVICLMVEAECLSKTLIGFPSQKSFFRIQVGAQLGGGKRFFFFLTSWKWEWSFCFHFSDSFSVLFICCRKKSGKESGSSLELEPVSLYSIYIAVQMLEIESKENPNLDGSNQVIN